MQMMSVSSHVEVGVELGMLATVIVLNALTGSNPGSFTEQLKVMSATPCMIPTVVLGYESW